MTVALFGKKTAPVTWGAWTKIRSVINRVFRGHRPDNVLRSPIRRAIALASQDGILVSHRNGKIIDCNEIALRLFGKNREDLLGAYLGGFVPAMEEPPELGGEFTTRSDPDKRQNNEPAPIQIQIENGLGERIPVEISVSTAETDLGPVTVSFIRDISERLSAEQALIQARDQALAGEKAKANLLAVMSHEMRTPLNGILGALQLLDETDLNLNQKGYVGVMETSAELLLHHVNSVLDISRVDSGVIDLTLREFSLSTCIQKLIESQQAAAMKKGNQISLTTVGQSIGNVVGDEGLVSQIILNLLGNGIKFTDHGRVDVEIERISPKEVEIRVTDTGVGISQSNLKKIFEEFVMVDSSFSRNQEGTGLGLAIVRRIVAALDGHIAVESELGEGTMFCLRLPLPQSDAPQIEPKRSSGETEIGFQPNLSILLVEDNEINRLIAREILTNMGCVVSIAKDGASGIELAEARKFDCIFMDISMPGIDGITATRTIRSGKGPNVRTPIIALTAHALEEDLAKFTNAGMDGTVLKPLQKSDLTSVFQRQFPIPAIDPGVSLVPDNPIADLQDRAMAEFREGVGQIDKNCSALQLVTRIHTLSGLAAVSGWTDSHSILTTAETQAKTGDFEAAMKSVERARLALGPEYPPSRH